MDPKVEIRRHRRRLFRLRFACNLAVPGAKERRHTVVLDSTGADALLVDYGASGQNKTEGLMCRYRYPYMLMESLSARADSFDHPSRISNIHLHFLTRKPPGPLDL
jgi:hypothetical protein